VLFFLVLKEITTFFQIIDCCVIYVYCLYLNYKKDEDLS